MINELPVLKISPIYIPDDRQQLTGKQILEIPESNLTFSKLQEYIDLAADYNIEIRFRPE